MRGQIFTFWRPFVLAAIIGALVLGTSSCNRNMPNGGVPIYLQIDSAKVVLSPGSPLGSSSSSIPGTWVTTGSQNLGPYEMPIDIPVLASGSVPLAISAGIYDNGIVNSPVEYPFYAPDTLTITNAIPGRVYHIKPVYSYYTYVQPALIENFDADNAFSNVTPVTNRADSDVFEGLRSGGIILSPSVDSLTATQIQPVVITTLANQAYLELNYKLPNANVLLDVGVIASLYSNGQVTQTTTYDKVVLTAPVGVWNKVYIDFNAEVGGNPNYSFQLYFTGYHQPYGPQDTVFLDNIKLLYH